MVDACLCAPSSTPEYPNSLVVQGFAHVMGLCTFPTCCWFARRGLNEAYLSGMTRILGLRNNIAQINSVVMLEVGWWGET